MYVVQCTLCDIVKYIVIKKRLANSKIKGQLIRPKIGCSAVGLRPDLTPVKVSFEKKFHLSPAGGGGGECKKKFSLVTTVRRSAQNPHL